MQKYFFVYFEFSIIFKKMFKINFKKLFTGLYSYLLLYMCRCNTKQITNQFLNGNILTDFCAKSRELSRVNVCR